MKSILYVVRTIKEFIKDKKYLLVYGAGNVALKCKDLLDNCHESMDYFVVTDDKQSRGGGVIDNIPIKSITGFPYTQDMTLDNVGVIIAVSEKYVEEILSNLNRIGIKNIYIYPEKLKSASIGITTRIGCAVACEYCPQKVFLSSYRARGAVENMLTLNSFKKFLHKIPKIVQINFAGFAEPFLNPECSAMIQYANEQGYDTEVYTTLIGVTDKIIDEIFNKTRFVVHLPDEENKTNIIIDSAYINSLKRILSLNKQDKRIKCISAPMGVNAKLSDLIPDDIEIQTGVSSRAGNLENIHDWNTTGSVTCERTYNRLDRNILLPNGDVVLCCNDWSLKNILGNLKEKSWAELLVGEVAESIREDMRLGTKGLICHSCDFAIELTD